MSKRAFNVPRKIARNHRFWLPTILIFLAAVAVRWSYSFAAPRRDNPPPAQPASGEGHKTAPQSLSDATEFGQFAPATDAERELEGMLRGKDDDIDLALANWLIAADIPQFADMPREAYFVELDAMTKQGAHGNGENAKSG